mgnify:FL=1
MESKNIMIVGVGGQGTLLASKLLGHLLMEQGYDVKVSEVHGMSQRGGSVVTYVKYGEKVYSPLVDLGEADCILSFEKLEAARFLPYLKKEGRLITNLQETLPMPVITGTMAYPQELTEKLEARCRLTAIDALSIAMESGSPKAVNVVLVGVLSRYMDIPEADWLSALEATVPPKFLELNKKAFLLGRAA